MRALMLSLLIVVSLAGCQSTTVEQDPGEHLLPEGTVSTIHTSLAPEFIPYARTISVWYLDWLPDLIVPASGAYIPFTKTIIVSAESRDPDVTLIHEILHVVAWKNMIPEQDEFRASLAKFMTDNRYTSIAGYARKKWRDYSLSWLYPSFMREDEYFAYIGSILLNRGQYGDTGLPEYMARHYRGILHPLLYLDHREYGEMSVPDWDDITVWYSRGGRLLCLTAAWADFEALYRYGGVVRPYISVPTVDIGAIDRIYDLQAENPGDIVLSAQTEPVCVTIPMVFRGADRDMLSNESWTVLRGVDTETGSEIFRQEIINPKQGRRKYLSLNGRQALRLFDAYARFRLRITLAPHQMALSHGR